MEQERERATIRRFLAWLASERDYRLCERGVADNGTDEWTPEPWTVERCLALYEARQQTAPAR